MMHDMMNMMPGGWLMGGLGLLVLLVLVLGVAALIKYLFLGGRGGGAAQS